MIVEDHPGTIDSFAGKVHDEYPDSKSQCYKKWKVFLMIWPILMAFRKTKDTGRG